MKFFFDNVQAPWALLALWLTAVEGDIGSADKFYHERSFLPPSIWAFGKQGVSIYSTDGSQQIKHHSNTDICKLTDKGRDCGFKAVVTDGKRYVFASNWQGEATIDVFSIDTGDFVASLNTCGNPWDLDYHPVRDEVWVHCWGPDEEAGDSGHLHVFSASALYTKINQVALHENLVGHAHGSVLVDSSLGHIGYATDLNTPHLYRVDLNAKAVTSQKEMPNVSGLYRMAYSHLNRHIYLRAYVCCSCGYDGADLPACGRGGARPVNVTTGPNQGINLDGTCGHGCEGSPADDIGVYEYDTDKDHIVGNWQITDGFGADPYVSPYGDYIALFGNNGGSSVRFLKPGVNGGLSTLWADVYIGFNTQGPSKEKAVSDSVFIQDSRHNIAIFTSTLSNSIVLVDMSRSKPTTRTLQLTSATDITSNHGRGARRNVIWAVGTDYVWVDGEKTEEFYVIKLGHDGDIKKAKVESVVNGVPARRLVFVENYQIQKDIQMMEDAINSRISNDGGDVSTTTGLISRNGEDKPVDSVGVTGVVLAVVALLLGAANVMMVMRLRRLGNDGHGKHGPEMWKEDNNDEAPSLPSRV